MNPRYKIHSILFKILLLIIFCRSVSSAITTNSEKEKPQSYALLIGVNSYKTYPLTTCINDVELFSNLLQTQFKFSKDSIKALTDQQATKEQIVHELENFLYQKSKKGDQVIFYFSGHGAQVHDYDRDEVDGLDEVICPVNVFDQSPPLSDQYITDDELSFYLNKISSKGVRVVSILDSCHSGTGTRDSAQEKYQAKFLDFGFTSETYPTAKTTYAPTGRMTLSACLPDQKAYTSIERGLSFFTDALVHILSQDPNMESNLLVNGLTASLSKPGQPTQQPMLDGAVKGPLILPNGMEHSEIADQEELVMQEESSENLEDASNSESFVFEDELIDGRDFKITIQTPKQDYIEGEYLNFVIRSEVDAYIRVYFIESNGRAQQIFPNKYSKDNKLHAGQIYQFPTRGFKIKLSPPYGPDTLKVVASRAQFSDLSGMLRGEPAPGITTPNIERHETSERGITVEQVQPGTTEGPAHDNKINRLQTAEAVTRFKVLPKKQ